MTILPPPRPEFRPAFRSVSRHECPTLATMRRLPSGICVSEYPDGTLWECPECARWWKYGGHTDCYTTPNEPLEWFPVRWYDVPARRRIAVHETEKRCPIVGRDESGCVVTRTLHWWDCHPNPNRGRA